MSSFDLSRLDSRQLAALMASADGGPSPCPPEDLGPILRHQLRAPLREDVGRLGTALERALARLGPGADGSPPSFADLPHPPAPPAELLEALKRFAGGQRTRPDA